MNAHSKVETQKCKHANVKTCRATVQRQNDAGAKRQRTATKTDLLELRRCCKHAGIARPGCGWADARFARLRCGASNARRLRRLGRVVPPKRQHLRPHVHAVQRQWSGQSCLLTHLASSCFVLPRLASCFLVLGQFGFLRTLPFACTYVRRDVRILVLRSRILVLRSRILVLRSHE
jgi:hypothetical protein